MRRQAHFNRSTLPKVSANLLVHTKTHLLWIRLSIVNQLLVHKSGLGILNTWLSSLEALLTEFHSGIYSINEALGHILRNWCPKEICKHYNTPLGEFPHDGCFFTLCQDLITHSRGAGLCVCQWGCEIDVSFSRAHFLSIPGIKHVEFLTTTSTRTMIANSLICQTTAVSLFGCHIVCDA